MKEINLYIILVDGVGYELVQSEDYNVESEIKKEYLRTHPFDEEGEVEVRAVDPDRLARLLF